MNNQRKSSAYIRGYPAGCRCNTTNNSLNRSYNDTLPIWGYHIPPPCPPFLATQNHIIFDRRGWEGFSNRLTLCQELDKGGGVTHSETDLRDCAQPGRCQSQHRASLLQTLGLVRSKYARAISKCSVGALVFSKPY